LKLVSRDLDPDLRPQMTLKVISSWMTHRP